MRAKSRRLRTQIAGKEGLKVPASEWHTLKIEMSGAKEILAVHIEKAAVDPEDVETLQDLILAASREASRRVDEAVQKKTASMLGGMLPGMR